MFDCSVEIVTRTEGDTGVFRAPGRLSRTADGFSVRYRDDSDEVYLFAHTDRFTMERRGECALACTFRKGVPGRMVFRLAGKETALPVNATAYFLRKSDEGYSVVLGYELGDSAFLQKFRLKITVKIISEEK
ncbi:MAG: DUF1934 family protein [Candidatus Gallimonas sp.]